MPFVVCQIFTADMQVNDPMVPCSQCLPLILAEMVLIRTPLHRFNHVRVLIGYPVNIQFVKVPSPIIVIKSVKT